MAEAALHPDDGLLDVLVVGAGLSGIGAAWHLQRHCPGKRYAVLEARDAIGGTWDLFRYPGVRSDSDMYTLGYAFQPWPGERAIADGDSIRRYICQVAHENGIERHIRFGHKALTASWSSRDACWTIEVEHAGARSTIRASFLYLCSGYYRYDQPHRPTFEGESSYRGALVLPQSWPEGLDYAGKRVAVIGSGATAVTLVPALAQTAAHVTMVQRSPSYVVNRPSEYGFARRLHRHLPARAAWAATRWRVIAENMFLYRFARRHPEAAKRRIVDMAQRQLGDRCDAGVHFTPHYKPWDQRVCVAPDGDLFKTIRSGRASVATGHIERFTEAGIRLQDGREIEADIVVLATGLQLQLLGGMAVSVDGQPFALAEAMAYKGMMLSSLPNCVLTFGYTNASWTLKADLTAAWTCRLLRHMDRHGIAIAVPQRQARVEPQPFLGFTSGYVQRAQALLPQQGSRRPWQVYQNYVQDMITIRYGRIADGVLRFGAKGAMP